MIDYKKNVSAFRKELDEICRRTHRDSSSVQILFATKYLTPDQFISFIDIMRQNDHYEILIGENRVQGWEEKYLFIKEKRPDLLDNIYPVMIGNLQRNKINKVIAFFNEIHSIDNLELAEALNTRLQRANKIIPVYFEVNISGEESKHGFPIDQINQAILTTKQYSNITIKGLMTMAPFTDNSEEVRGVFRKLKELADRYKLLTSMGMSHDWKIAVEEGSDMVRIGSAIFT